MVFNKCLLAFLLTATAVMSGSAFGSEMRLPNLGSSAGQIASPEQQRQYGFYVLHELRNQNGVLDDALLADYLNTLGYRLVANSPQPDQAFTFFIVRDTEINAFALPGGFVGVNAGLILTTETENELAAVLAHEISHITQNHLIRAVEAEQKMTPLMILAMIGAIAASAHQNPYSTSNADVGAMAAVQGLFAQMQINFTRADESEADRVGINTLAKSGFDPDAMAGFFERMQRALRPGFDENDVPALLMDHPVTTTRISEAKARADVIKKEYHPEVTVGDIEEPGKPEAAVAAAAKGETQQGTASDPARPVQISAISLLPKIGQVPASARPAESHARQRMRAQAYYLLMRERVRVLSSPHAAEMVTYYAENLRDHADFDTPANRYGYALALTLDGKAKQAYETLRKFGEADPENLVFQIALGNAELYMGARDAALQRYARIEKSFPNNRALALAHADALLANGDKASGKIAEELLRSQLARDDEDPDLQTTFAHACELAGDTVRAGEAHATAAYLNGRAEDALNQLKQIAKRGDLNYYQRTRVEALIAQMTPLVLDMRRHKIRPEDQGKLAATGPGSAPKQGLSFCVADKCNGSNNINAKQDPQTAHDAWPGRFSPQWPSSKSQILSPPSSNGNNDPLQ